MATSAVALSCLTWSNCTTDVLLGAALNNDTVHYTRSDVNASTNTRFGDDAADDVISVGILNSNGISISIYGYTFVIIILSVAVLFAILFTICRLFVKAEAHSKAADHVEHGIMFGNSEDECA